MMGRRVLLPSLRRAVGQGNADGAAAVVTGGNIGAGAAEPEINFSINELRATNEKS